MVELIHSAPSPVIQRRLTRIMMDVRLIATLTRAEARTLYEEIETARDVLSRVLDRADGKEPWGNADEQS